MTIKDNLQPTEKSTYFSNSSDKYKGEAKMNSIRRTARIVGVLFIIATIAAIIGRVLYQPIMSDPDYIIKGPANENQVILGVFFELILVGAAVGTSIMLFPYLKKQNESIALGYVGFRLLEAVLIVIGLVSLLSLLTLSQEFASGVVLDASSFQTVGRLLLTVHAWTIILGTHFMLGIGTLMYSYLFYQSKLVPRWLSVWGLIAAVSIFVSALLEMFGVILTISLWAGILAIPVAFYEMVLAVWLIVKGFYSSAIASGSVKTDMNEEK